jgi:hypothetical protein
MESVKVEEKYIPSIATPTEQVNRNVDNEFIQGK